MSEKKQDQANDQFTGKQMLEKAVNELNEPVLEELDRHIANICSGIAQHPQKGGSLSIDIKIKAVGQNSKLLAHTVEITKIKVPKAPGKAGFAYRGPDGGMVSKDPDQVQLFDEEAEKINQETGEVTKVDGDSNVSSIGKAKGKK